MDYTDKEYCLEVWGDYGCFTRPEYKAERCSYDVITPSAARAIFEAIFWKPAIRWEVTKIEVLNEIQFINIKKHELTSKVTKPKPIYIDDKIRTLRNNHILYDLRYRIWAKQIFIPVKDRLKNNMDMVTKNENPAKYNAIFERRASAGQCFKRPYFGKNEYPVDFRLVDVENEELQQPIQLSQDFETMMYDFDYSSDSKKPIPMFFHAIMNEGVIEVPSLNTIKEIVK